MKILIPIIIIFLLLLTACQSEDPANIELAKCITQKDVKMYGAFWCGHCKEQKELFGKTAFEEIDYIECSLPNGQGRTEICKRAGIESYPTWVLPDGSQLPKTPLAELAQKTGCEYKPTK